MALFFSIKLEYKCKEYVEKITIYGIVSPQKKGRVFSIHFGGYENLVRLYAYMYKDSTVSLDRKRTHFQDIINTKKYVRACQTN